MELNLAGKPIGAKHPPFVIAEIGANHNGDMELCKRMIDAAVDCSADAVKFQSWTAKSLLSRKDRDNKAFYDEVARYQLLPDDHVQIQQYCQSRGIVFCSTPFSFEEADMLEELDVPFFKIASMDLNHPAFLRHVARKNRTMLVSTGMGTLGEIEAAVEAIRGEGNDRIVLLHCVALYPPDFNLVHLQNITLLAEVFGLPTGYSDHTIGVGCPLGAIALGACVIEKHFTLDKNLEGWDHAVSADPAEMKVIVEEGRNIQTALGEHRRTVSDQEKEKAQFFRRSVIVKRDMKPGETITEDDLDYKRPGTGIPPNKAPDLVGRTLVKEIREDELILWSHLKG